MRREQQQEERNHIIILTHHSIYDSMSWHSKDWVTVFKFFLSESVTPHLIRTILALWVLSCVEELCFVVCCFVLDCVMDCGVCFG